MIPESFLHKDFISRAGEQLARLSRASRSARPFATGAVVALAVAAVLAAQETAGEKTRVGARTGTEEAPVATYSGKGADYQVAPQKAKATVQKVDLEKRTVTVVPVKKGGQFKVAELGPAGRTWLQVDEMECGFVVAPGMEKITVSKAAAKALGKKSITLDELPVGSEIKIEYYPVPRALLAITLERAGS